MDSKRTFFLAITLVLVIVAVAVAACGSGTTTTTAAATATTAAPASTDTTAAGSTDTTAASTDTTAASTDTSAAAASGTLIAKGLVDTPATWTISDLQKMNPVTATVTHPKKGDMQVTGVKLSDLFKTLGVQAAAKTLDTTSTDGYVSEIAISDIPADALLGIGSDGKLNMIMPGMTGKAWATDVVGWEFK